MNDKKIQLVTSIKEITNGVESTVYKYLEYAIDEYGIPFGHYCIKMIYAIYTHLTFFNVMLFVLKWVPTSICMFKYIKKVYVPSREWFKLKQLELDEIQLQIHIVESKLSVREAEFCERKKLLRSELKKLRTIRARVRKVIANDDEFRNAVNRIGLLDENCSNANSTSEEDDFLVEILKENSVYSSAGDADGYQERHVKIVKVMLSRFIKQKRMRRANKHALLRKKMDNIKKLLEDWQKTLNMVSKLSMLSFVSPQIEIASQEAMGDCTKSNFYNCSDSDSDFRNSPDNYQEDYNVKWSQNQYKAFYAYNNYDEFTGDTEVAARECYDVEKYNCQEEHNCSKGSGVLYVVPEETKSQLEIKEVQRDGDNSL